LTIEILWLVGLFSWVLIRLLGLIKFKRALNSLSTSISVNNLNLNLAEFKHYTTTPYFFTFMPTAPFITGLIKPQIYLPQDTFNQLNTIQQQCIIKHELTHLQRKDLWTQILAEVIRTLFWFNPIVHIAWNAFRQDQELACDYQVLAKSSKSERFEYGRVLLKGLHAHALPATMAFFNNHKQRFIMLEKHNNSKINIILGITLCTVLLVFALTKAPQSIAKQLVEDTIVSFKFDQISLKNILELINQANPREILGYENIPEKNISFEAWGVSANQVEKLLLKCSGLKLIQSENKFKIVNDLNFNNDFSKLNECVQIQSNKKNVPEASKEAIKNRNKQLREYLKKHKMDEPDPYTLPFEDIEK